MKFRQARRYFAITAAVSLMAGCVTNPLSTEGKSSEVNIPSLTLKIPSDPNIQPRKVTRTSTSVVRDMGYDNRSVTAIQGAMYGRVLTESVTQDSFVVHARIDNGVAGSGVKYNVGYRVQDSANGYQVVLTPRSRSTYQQGVIGAFPVPDFTEKNLRFELTSLQILYKFEVDTPYNSESVTANFVRLGKPRTTQQGWADPITGKIFTSYYTSTIRGKDMPYVVQVFPYRNGSKVVINAVLSGVETSPNVVDFGIIINDAKASLEQIAKS